MKQLVRVWACLVLLGTGMAVQARTVHLYYTDPQGTVLAKTDAQGNILARYDYRPYGGVVSGNGPDGPGYTGHVQDPETGLVYMQARYYDPAGRFPSPDPVGAAPGNLFSFNRYDYANNNPLRYTDPSGRCAEYYSKADGGGCKVEIDPSLIKNKRAQTARKAVESALNKYDKAINALPDGKSYSVFTKNSHHRTETIGYLTGKQIKALWNGQHFSIVPNGTYMRSNGGLGARCLVIRHWSRKEFWAIKSAPVWQRRYFTSLGILHLLDCR